MRLRLPAHRQRRINRTLTLHRPSSQTDSIRPALVAPGARQPFGPCTPTTPNPARGRSGARLFGDRFDFTRRTASSLALRAATPEGFDVFDAELPRPA